MEKGERVEVTSNWLFTGTRRGTVVEIEAMHFIVDLDRAIKGKDEVYRQNGLAFSHASVRPLTLLELLGEANDR